MCIILLVLAAVYVVVLVVISLMVLATGAATGGVLGAVVGAARGQEGASGCERTTGRRPAVASAPSSAWSWRGCYSDSQRSFCFSSSLTEPFTQGSGPLRAEVLAHLRGGRRGHERRQSLYTRETFDRSSSLATPNGSQALSKKRRQLY